MAIIDDTTTTDASATDASITGATAIGMTTITDTTGGDALNATDPIDTDPIDTDPIDTDANDTGATTLTDFTSDDALNARIQNIAQELQDLILDFTLAIKPTVVHIDDNYKPPWQLTINRGTRKNVAKAYYRDCTFEWVENYRWHRSVPVDHRASLTKLRIKRLDKTDELYDAWYCLSWTQPLAKLIGIPISIFRTNVQLGDKMEWLDLETIEKMLNESR